MGYGFLSYHGCGRTVKEQLVSERILRLVRTMIAGVISLDNPTGGFIYMLKMMKKGVEFILLA